VKYVHSICSSHTVVSLEWIYIEELCHIVSQHATPVLYIIICVVYYLTAVGAARRVHSRSCEIYHPMTCQPPVQIPEKFTVSENTLHSMEQRNINDEWYSRQQI